MKKRLWIFISTFIALLGFLSVTNHAYADKPFCGNAGSGSGIAGSGNSCVRYACPDGNFTCAYCVSSFDFNQTPNVGCLVTSGNGQTRWWNSWLCGVDIPSNIWNPPGIDPAFAARAQAYCDQHLTNQPTPTPTPPPAQPTGKVGAYCTAEGQAYAGGYACDPVHPTTIYPVRVYIDGNLYMTTSADQASAGLEASCGGNNQHAFGFTFPTNDYPYKTFDDGNGHAISAVAVKPDGSTFAVPVAVSGAKSDPSKSALNCKVTGTISADPTSCDIPYNQTSCTTTVSWSSYYASYPAVYEDHTAKKIASGANGSVTASIPSSGSVFDLVDEIPSNSTTKASNTITIQSTGGNSLNKAAVTARQLHLFSGIVGVDANNNNAVDPGEGSGGIKVNISGKSGAYTASAVSATDGTFNFPNIPPDVYTVTLDKSTLPANTRQVLPTQTSWDLTNPANRIVSTQFVLQKLYSISGNVFKDINKNKKFDPTEVLYTGGTVTYSPAQSSAAVPSPSGKYEIDGLPPGNYFVGFSGLPDGYSFTTPQSGAAYAVTLGPNCTVPAGTEGGCDTENNITTLNIGISNAFPWWQSHGLDVHLDDFTQMGEQIPANACGSVASVPGTSLTPGVMNGGGSSPSFGLYGNASNLYNWQLGGGSYSTRFTQHKRTSYQAVMQAIKETGAQIPELRDTLPSCKTYNNCDLTSLANVVTPPNPFPSPRTGTTPIPRVTVNPIPSARPGGPTLPPGTTVAPAPPTRGLVPEAIKTYADMISGHTSPTAVLAASTSLLGDTLVYNVSGDMTLTTDVHFGRGASYVFLVKGNLRLLHNITVDPGGFVAFIVSSTIYIDSGVGQSTSACTPTNGNLEGFFSADKSVVMQGHNDCTLGVDTQLVIDGSLVANAGNSGGTLQNQRDLCAQDLSYPALVVRERPDMVLSTPNILKRSQNTFQEIAP